MKQLIIRKTNRKDLSNVMGIYAEARKFMCANGNPNQWGNNHPTQLTIEDDIRRGTSYLCIHKNAIAAVFYFNVEADPTYSKIDGKWLYDSSSYGVVHRIARAENGAGAGAFCLNWCFAQHPNIRIDTHKDNIPMLALLNKLGFVYCGVIWLANGDERLAFQRVYG